MQAADLLMALILVLGVLARSMVIVAAAAFLLLLEFLDLHGVVFPWLEKWALQIGLTFLMLAVLVPLAEAKSSWPDLGRSVFSLPGAMALIGGLLATRLNLEGLQMLQEQPGLMVALVGGCLLGIVLLGGIPVGPLMAAGVAAFLLWVLSLFGL
ncbi:MAG: DUF441 domain-containing protein [Clostridia bacterium]|nr:MAG: DUF441 domain-containing protein [Clostridia bacterium]